MSVERMSGFIKKGIAGLAVLGALGGEAPEAGAKDKRPSSVTVSDGSRVAFDELDRSIDENRVLARDTVKSNKKAPKGPRTKGDPIKKRRLDENLAPTIVPSAHSPKEVNRGGIRGRSIEAYADMDQTAGYMKDFLNPDNDFDKAIKILKKAFGDGNTVIQYNGVKFVRRGDKYYWGAEGSDIYTQLNNNTWRELLVILGEIKKRIN